MSELRWTPQQAAAITETRHALLVANAGTGKTATVIGKVRWLLGLNLEPARDASGGTVEMAACPDPCELREIAAITFTEKAAYDLKRRLRRAILTSEKADELRWQIDRASIGTIHSFCGELLREHALRLEIDPTFRVLDERESWTAQDDLIGDVIKAALADGDEGAGLLLQSFPLTSRNYRKGVVDYVRDAMRDLRWHEDRYVAWLDADRNLDETVLRELAGEWADELDGLTLRQTQALVHLAQRALERWLKYLVEENVRDFDALILDARRLLTGPDSRAALDGIRRRFRILVIDEFQDTDDAQRDIAFAIAGLLGDTPPVQRPQLFLVGDPKQSIYRFRGADISVWNQVESTLAASGRVLELSENFRCAPPIVDYVNDACAEAMTEVGAAIDEQGLGSRVAYADLVAGVASTGTARLEWLVAENRNETKTGKVTIKADHPGEAAQVAARIQEMVGNEEICDPDTGERRPIDYSDIVVLYRSRNVLADFESALSRQQVPYYVAGAPHLGDRQEIRDLLNLLRLLRNPCDDYRAFGFLRSPFVSLRDETIVHVALEVGGRSLLARARKFLEQGEWFDGPEGAAVSEIERRSLTRALDAFDEARKLLHRVPLDEVLQRLIDRLGYRLPLIVRGGAEEPLANIQSFLQFTEAYRDHDIATFLEVWDRWDAQDNGLPQAPLYSKDDDVVTLTTIHRAKGLEWPVVFLVGTGTMSTDRATGDYWSDPALGPLLCPKKDERGKRTVRLWRRSAAENRAEEARLLYVATTRARDRLLIVGPRERENSYSAWLAPAVGRHPFHVRDDAPELLPPTDSLEPSLAWLDAARPGGPPSLLAVPPEPPPRFVVSATELMGRAKDEATWRLRYRHGVQPKWEFAGPFEEGTLRVDEPDRGVDDDTVDEPVLPVPATVRGTVIHGVLERIREEAELSRLLREAIGDLDDPDLEEALASSHYREALEDEIRRVVRSEQWAWYVEGEHWRELEFVHLAGPREWRVGAFDLYRPGPDGAWVIDFKTHEIEASEAPKVARDYDIQVRVYREASAIRAEARVGLHFTGPNVLVEK